MALRSIENTIDTNTKPVRSKSTRRRRVNVIESDEEEEDTKKTTTTTEKNEIEELFENDLIKPATTNKKTSTTTTKKQSSLLKIGPKVNDDVDAMLENMIQSSSNSVKSSTSNISCLSEEKKVGVDEEENVLLSVVSEHYSKNGSSIVISKRIRIDVDNHKESTKPVEIVLVNDEESKKKEKKNEVAKANTNNNDKKKTIGMIKMMDAPDLDTDEKRTRLLKRKKPDNDKVIVAQSLSKAEKMFDDFVMLDKDETNEKDEKKVKRERKEGEKKVGICVLGVTWSLFLF